MASWSVKQMLKPHPVVLCEIKGLVQCPAHKEWPLTALASPGNLLGSQILGLNPSLTESETAGGAQQTVFKQGHRVILMPTKV